MFRNKIFKNRKTIQKKKEETYTYKNLLRKAISRTRYGRKIFLPIDNPEDHSTRISLHKRTLTLSILPTAIGVSDLTSLHNHALLFLIPTLSNA